jgi:hypothetical protein
MKPVKYILMLVCAAAINSIWAEPAAAQQRVCSLGYYNNSNEYNPNLDSPPTPHALSIARRVAEVLCGGVCRVSLLQNPTAGNALTLVFPNGQAKVVYQPHFMQQIEQAYGESAAFGIFAHETGHVIDGRTKVSWMLNSWNRELRADAWAGCALARAGLSILETKAALRAIAQYPSPSHPAWDRRLPALEAGYSQCGGRGGLPKW